MEKLSKAAIEAIKTAIELEKKGNKFFLELASRTKNEFGKKMFTTLAKDEEIHLKVFTKMFEDAMASPEWVELVGEVTGARKVPMFEEETINKQRAVDKITEVASLELALNQEMNAIDFFKKVVGQTIEEDAKKIFEEILNQEEGHYLMIQGEIDYINKTGYWFDIADFKYDGIV